MTNGMSGVAVPKTYRPNVAAILINPAGQVLIGERVDQPGCWQFPQGGLDANESPEEGLPREIYEELSLEPGDYAVEGRRGPYRYLFPPGRTKEGFHGQEQQYFLLRLLSPASRIDVATVHPEFRAVRWIEPREFSLNWLPAMKHEVYRQVFLDFFEVGIT